MATRLGTSAFGSMGLRKRQRILLVAVVLGLGGTAATLVLSAMQEKISFFMSPSELSERQVEPGRLLRVGGLVVQGSIQRGPDGTIRFALTDGAHEVTIAYRGILPDLFREGQGVVVQGSVTAAGGFQASEVLAKHDERYMPKEVAESLQRSGHWKPEEARP
jgi:cytochrome c-type biogenesis protein CcmE